MELLKIFTSELNEKPFKTYKIMALTISENNGIFLVEGTINATTSKNLKMHCKTLLKACGHVTIDIQQIAYIDVNGLLALRDLYDYAKQTNTAFFIVGDGCKEIYDEFRYAA